MKMIKRVIGCNVVNGGSCVYACIWELYGGYMGGLYELNGAMNGGFGLNGCSINE